MAYVEKSGFRAKVIDAVARNYSKGDTIKLIKDFSPRLIAVATSTPSIGEDIAIAEQLKTEISQATVMLVGRHASWAPEETLKLCAKVDGVIKGEYYKACVEILNGNSISHVKGIAFRNQGEIALSAEGKPIDPNDIPLISPIIKRDLGIEDYFYASLRNPYTMLQHSWGCSFNCDFCDEFYKASYRHREPDLTIRELKYIETEMPSVREVLFDDPTFAISEKHTTELCRAMITNRIKLTWSCNLRSSVSYDTLKLMRQAGCRLAHVGIESLTQEGKDSVHKRISLDEEVRFLRDAKKAGILIHGCFIVGLPSENASSMRQTIDRAKALPFDTIQVIPLIPTPHTSSWKWARENGFLTTTDYSKWIKDDGSYRCVVSRPGFSCEEAEAWVDRFIREFYFRPSYVWYKSLQSLKSWQEMKRNVKSVLNLVRRLGQKGS